MDTYQCIMTRRSVRKFKDTPIPEDLVNKMIEAGRYAPSWANTQCARFIWVKDQENKKKLASAFHEKNPGYNSLLTAPLVLVGFAEKQKAGYKKGEIATKKGDWFMFDTALAVQNIVLTAWDSGVGSVYMGSFDSDRVNEVMNIPENFDSVIIVPFGYPDEEPKCPPRKAIEEIVFYETAKKS